MIIVFGMFLIDCYIYILEVLNYQNKIFLDLYVEQVGQSFVMDCQLIEFREMVEQEVNYMIELSEVMGMFDMVFVLVVMKMSIMLLEIVFVMMLFVVV